MFSNKTCLCSRTDSHQITKLYSNTPNRTKINKIGIEPNETVELPKDVQNSLTIKKEQDTQLQKAIEILK